jgi:hypothetical protein
MRSQAICTAILLAFIGTAAAPMPVSPVCTRAPHMAERHSSPQLIAARRAEHQACAADMANFCANVPKGCGRPKQCLMAHASQLSASCRAAWQNLRGMRHGA